MGNLIEIYDTLAQDGKISRDPAQEDALQELERIRSALELPAKKGWFSKAPEPPKGLYLWGGVGRGKSMIMDMFVDHLAVPSRRVHFHAFMQEVHAGLHEARSKDIEDTLGPVAKSVASAIRCLALDEMQITDITDAMLVGRLFEALFAAGVVVVTTSNRVPGDLYKNGLNRQLFLPFIDLLNERMVVHEMESATDYRQGRLEGTQTYFFPDNAHAKAQLDEIWNDLTDGKSEPHTLIVNKREVHLPQFHNGVARAKFYDICGRMLGPADYLAIAKAARVFIIDNIPRLGRDNFNEAKRFVTLIDALYEEHVRLICSASAKPEYLYLEGEGAFEFERTASRLREMQSEGWGRAE